jgi:hypothetical protein
MANDVYTLILVPHAKARFRKFQVPVKVAKWALGSGGVLATVVMGILVHYGRITVEVHQLRRLRAENAVLTAKTQEYEQNAAKLEAKMRTLQGMVKKLGVMAGLDGTLPDSTVGGVGGVSSSDSIPPLQTINLSLMDNDLTELTAKSQKLDRFFTDQKVLLSSTPSIWPVHGYLSAGFGNRVDPFTGE